MVQDFVHPQYVRTAYVQKALHRCFRGLWVHGELGMEQSRWVLRPVAGDLSRASKNGLGGIEVTIPPKPKT